jgi:hypothetical protein
MAIPPMTQDLWPAVREWLKTPEQAVVLKGPNRVYVRGDLKADGQEAELTPEGPENQAWGRLVIVPAIPVDGTAFEPLLPSRLQFLLVSEFNDLQAVGYPLARDLELSQRDAARRLYTFDPATLSSSQIMLASGFNMDRQWQAQPLRDTETTTGTVYVSSSWWVAAASAAD